MGLHEDLAREFTREALEALIKAERGELAKRVADAIAGMRALDRAVRDEVLVLLFEVVACAMEELKDAPADVYRSYRLVGEYPECAFALRLAEAALGSRYRPATRAVAKMLRLMVEPGWVDSWLEHHRALLGALAAHWSDYGQDHEVLLRVQELLALARSQEHGAQIAARLEDLLHPDGRLPISDSEPWTEGILVDCAAMSEGDRAHFVRLLRHCSEAKEAKPSAKWTKKANELAGAIEAGRLRTALERWLALVDTPLPASNGIGASARKSYAIMPPAHGQTLRGLCWLASGFGDDAMARILATVVASCYRKVPGKGPRAILPGNAAIHALAALEGRTGLAQLAILRVEIKAVPAQKRIAVALDAVAARLGLPRDQIEELAAPDYGMETVGRMEREFGECRAIVSLGGVGGSAAVTLSWVDAKGRAVKSPPAAVRRDSAAEVKELKHTVTDIQKMLSAQRSRLDSLFGEQREWPLAFWREAYLDHALIGTLARRLIWTFRDGEGETAATWLPDADSQESLASGGLVTVDGRAFAPSAGSMVRLWHPMLGSCGAAGAGIREDAPHWQAFFEDRRIRQPFKQAHRETYPLTDAERTTGTFSNRFAGHIVRQHMFNALCAERGWAHRLRLSVDADYKAAHKVFPSAGLRAELRTNIVGDAGDYISGTSVFLYLHTDQVLFFDAATPVGETHAWGGSEYTHGGFRKVEVTPIPLSEIPPLLLSEVFRDVDLFVGVASVAADSLLPEEENRPEVQSYWQRAENSPLAGGASSRRELLKRIIPRLAIAPACTVTDRHLVVLGKLHAYKIHIGSGNILIAPDDRYLCIVPKVRAGGPEHDTGFVPFEGDGILSVILSKAFLLAHDDAITDPTIVSQIRAQPRESVRP